MFSLKRAPPPIPSPPHHSRAQARWAVREIDPDEYDAAAHRWPEHCPLRALGDGRSGRELLAGFPADDALTLRDLAAAPAGRLLLAQLPMRLEALALRFAEIAVGGGGGASVCQGPGSAAGHAPP